MDPEKRKAVAATATTLIVLPVLTIALRWIAVHVVRKGKYGMDDWLAIATLPFIVAGASVNLAMAVFDAHGGFRGIPQDAPAMANPNEMPSPAGLLLPAKMQHMIIAMQFLYLFGLSLPRLSIVCFYHNIFGKTKRWFHFALCLIGTSCLLWLIVNIIVTATKCTPLEAQFTFSPMNNNNCINITAYNISVLATSIAIDLALIILPMPMIFNIKTSLAKRLSIAFAFVCGGSIIIFTTGRLIMTVRAGPFATGAGFEKGGAMAAFIQLEASMSLVTVSLPTILTLIRHLFSRLTKKFKDRRSHVKLTNSTTADNSLQLKQIEDSASKLLLARSNTPYYTSPLPEYSVSKAFYDNDLERMTSPTTPQYAASRGEYHDTPNGFI